MLRISIDEHELMLFVAFSGLIIKVTSSSCRINGYAISEKHEIVQRYFIWQVIFHVIASIICSIK